MRQRVWVAGVLGLALAAAASRAAVLVTGAGATFPYPIYSKWFDEFHKHFSDFQINYQSIGSGGGIRQVTEGTVDFGATDGPMTDEQLAAAKIPILHLPTVRLKEAAAGADGAVYADAVRHLFGLGDDAASGRHPRQ